MGEGEHKCIMEERVRALETDQAETRIYVKEIREDIQEIKADIKKAAQHPQPKEDSRIWSQIVIELIKLVTYCVAVLGGVIGAAKIIGKDG